MFLINGSQRLSQTTIVLYSGLGTLEVVSQVVLCNLANSTRLARNSFHFSIFIVSLRESVSDLAEVPRNLDRIQKTLFALFLRFLEVF